MVAPAALPAHSSIPVPPTPCAGARKEHPMDAHFDQVQKARSLAHGGQPRNYFAYSTVLDRPAFEEWRTQHGYVDFELPEGKLAEARGLGLVFDFPSRWWGGRVASLADVPGQRVFGKLFTL